jgi:nicotinamidase-related amidase
MGNNNKTNDTMEVLVIIDVQNCFMFHQDKVAGDLNVENEADSIKIVQELETLVADKTHVVFSRDFHPVNHISLAGYEGREVDYESIWPKHCRNKNRKCNARNGDNKGEDKGDNKGEDKGEDKGDNKGEDKGDNKGEEEGINNNFVKIADGAIIKYKTNPGDESPNLKWTEINNTISTDPSSNYLEVIGTELSYMFFTSDTFREPVRQLIINNREGKHKIGLEDTMNEKNAPPIDNPDDAVRIISSIAEPLEFTTKINNKDKITKYISLTKGERCDKEAYSAFNYHIEYTPGTPYEPNNTKKIDNIELNKANSTGLWEWILKTANDEKRNKITITVCGLVGNVCVMHSLLQGIALWNNVYSKEDMAKEVEVKFVYSLRGTRFTATAPPNQVMPEFDDKVVEWFNNNLPTGMGTINIKNIPDTNVSNVIHRNIIESFEVLDYEGTPIKVGTFENKPSQSGSGMRRRRRSVRRRGNKSRKLQKRQKGRRTYKNKPRRTKRR